MKRLTIGISLLCGMWGCGEKEFDTDAPVYSCDYYGRLSTLEDPGEGSYYTERCVEYTDTAYTPGKKSLTKKEDSKTSFTDDMLTTRKAECTEGGGTWAASACDRTAGFARCKLGADATIADIDRLAILKAYPAIPSGSSANHDSATTYCTDKLGGTSYEKGA